MCINFWSVLFSTSWLFSSLSISSIPKSMRILCAKFVSPAPLSATLLHLLLLVSFTQTQLTYDKQTHYSYKTRAQFAANGQNLFALRESRQAKIPNSKLCICYLLCYSSDSQEIQDEPSRETKKIVFKFRYLHKTCFNLYRKRRKKSWNLLPPQNLQTRLILFLKMPSYSKEEIEKEKLQHNLSI